MRIEEGKFYRAANGGKVGPVSCCAGSKYPFEAPFNGADPARYRPDGSCPYLPERDVVALWSEGPVRTVQRIIPGTYDGVVVESAHVSKVFVRLANQDAGFTAHELDRAAAVLTALAGALRDAS